MTVVADINEDGILYAEKCFLENVLFMGGGSGVSGESNTIKLRNSTDNLGQILFRARVPQDSSKLFNVTDFWKDDFDSGIFVEFTGPGTPQVLIWLEPDGG